MPILFCIKCQIMDQVYDGTHRVFEIHDLGSIYYWTEWKECSGPFAFSEPIPFPLDIDGLTEPSPDELANMDQAAIELQNDFIL